MILVAGDRETALSLVEGALADIRSVEWYAVDGDRVVVSVASEAITWNGTAVIEILSDPLPAGRTVLSIRGDPPATARFTDVKRDAARELIEEFRQAVCTALDTAEAVTVCHDPTPVDRDALVKTVPDDRDDEATADGPTMFPDTYDPHAEQRDPTLLNRAVSALGIADSRAEVDLQYLRLWFDHRDRTDIITDESGELDPDARAAFRRSKAQSIRLLLVAAVVVLSLLVAALVLL